MRLGQLRDLADVIATLRDWAVSIAQDFVARPSVQAATASTVVARAWQLVQVDATAGDVTITFEAATPRNRGTFIWVSVTAGANYALIGGLVYKHGTWCSNGSAWVQVAGPVGASP